jgi:predicted nucleotidyltransferase
MIQLFPEQIEALRELQALCREIETDVVVIGAIAYRVWVSDEKRTTEDLDVAVAVDLEELHILTEGLVSRGWRQDKRYEHRWYSPANARLDLLPAGTKAREEKQITWPLAGTRMRLIGYDHVFADAVECQLAPGLKARVVPLAVLGLLKIAAYLDDPHGREKDLQDLARLMERYEEDGERRFSDEVLDAGVDYESAGAYLLGRDLAALCDERDEFEVVSTFIRQLSDANHLSFQALVQLAGKDRPYQDGRLARGIAALARGFQEMSGSAGRS